MHRKVRVYLENAQSIRYHHLTTEEMLITLIHLDGLVHRLLLYSGCVRWLCGPAGWHYTGALKERGVRYL